MKDLLPALPLLVAAPAVCFSIACHGAKNNSRAPVREPTVTIETGEGRAVRVKVEIARTDEERATGLMYRDKIEPGTGMVFLFDAPAVHTFWMKNTYVPLDMIFIGSDMRIAGVVESAEPLTTSPRKVDAPSQFVLEVAGGFCARHGIAKGMKVSFSGIE